MTVIAPELQGEEVVLSRGRDEAGTDEDRPVLHRAVNAEGQKGGSAVTAQEERLTAVFDTA
ncbi:MAG: hypothetical protein CME15_14710 [Gemmatimonadetes bacterium]|nr:hypothetical protein [Gemmatimonadota bacterium]